MTTLLVVDDDPHVRDVIAIYFSQLGYRVITARDGMAALQQLQEHAITLAIIDVMMPYLDGYELTRTIRNNYNLPVILLTAKGQLEDKEKGYIAGTDDYVVKPVDPKELQFRVEALLRRYEAPSPTATLHLGPLTILTKSYEIKVNDRTLILPLKEFELLAYLVKHATQVLTREQIIEEVWGIDYCGDERTVDVHIKRLRARLIKLAPSIQIKTVRGIGYSIEETQ
ncbi:MAG: response regulator transcription factor [Solibacillus sp.]|jgi:two-component system, OmpR family, response regulator|uniref:response regulator transcription factor n=1 Tax=unclassified Solibacillus TaxID=2637870 RepID=UPI0030F7C690